MQVSLKGETEAEAASFREAIGVWGYTRAGGLWVKKLKAPKEGEIRGYLLEVYGPQWACNKTDTQHRIPGLVI